MTGLLVALDFASVGEAVAMARTLKGHVAGFKVGLELLLGPDPHALDQVVEIGLPVFADAKLHDIPATVEKAARQLGSRGARWVTVHASGGESMLSAAVSGLGDGSDQRAGVLAVTVLTSLGKSDLASVGIGDGAAQHAQRLAALAAISGAEGVICAVTEIPSVRKFGADLIAVTPGIRSIGSPRHDQMRAATPAEARAAGADYVVVGRPITQATDPIVAASEMAIELDKANGDGEPSPQGLTSD